MSYQPRFFEKNKADFSLDTVTVTASQGQDTAYFTLNRNNLTAWVTSGSVDADNTTYVVDWSDQKTIDSILLVQHNFKAFTVKYWDGAAYQDFSTPIAQTVNTSADTFYSFTAVATTKIKITITGTMVANDDKYLYQFIATKAIGQFAGWPVFKKPTLSKNKIITKMLSGKESVRDQIGSYKVSLEIKILSSTADVALIETIFDSIEGFLFWPCGGSEAQFITGAQSYRKRDIYLMKSAGDYVPELYNGIYSCGIHMLLPLTEVVD
jgi:hypothetical protein